MNGSFAIDAMMLHRSVRKASRILSVTPSAVSHALSRLRLSISNQCCSLPRQSVPLFEWSRRTSAGSRMV